MNIYFAIPGDAPKLPIWVLGPMVIAGIVMMCIGAYQWVKDWRAKDDRKSFLFALFAVVVIAFVFVAAIVVGSQGS